MKRTLFPVIWLLFVALIAAGLSLVTKLEFWWAFLIVAIAIVLNGIVATMEDDLPGGFDSPTKKAARSRFSIIATWVIRGIGVLMLIVLIVAICMNYFNKH